MPGANPTTQELPELLLGEEVPFPRLIGQQHAPRDVRETKKSTLFSPNHRSLYLYGVLLYQIGTPPSVSRDLTTVSKSTWLLKASTIISMYARLEAVSRTTIRCRSLSSSIRA